MAGLFISNARIATLRGGRYSIVEHASLRCEDGRITALGSHGEVPRRAGDEVIDAHGALVTPGLVDCHTHLVFAGDRARDFAMRLAGKTYEEIAKAGGGIVSTMRATREAGDAELRAASARRLESLMRDGVTTAEIKSGYGLDAEHELRCLRIARSLAADHAVSLTTTLLAAHAVPPEFAGRADAYVDEVCERMIPRAAAEGLADAVDAFCESIAFTPAQVSRVFEAARRHGLRVKLHADQLTDGGGAALAARYGAVSADHLEHAGEEGIAAMARAGTVAVLLPAAYYFLRDKHPPPVEAFRRHRVPLAVSTDCNPGTSPCASLLTAMNMACTLFGLSPEESLAGATCHAAAALGLDDRGVLEPGKRADFVLWDADDPAQLAWNIAGLEPRSVYFEGRLRSAHAKP